MPLPSPPQLCLCRYAWTGAGLSVWPSEVAPCDTERLGLDTSRTRVFSPDRDDNGTHGEDYGPRLSDSAAICGAVSWGCCSFICSHKLGRRWAEPCISAVPGTSGHPWAPSILVHPCVPCIPTCLWSPCEPLGTLHYVSSRILHPQMSPCILHPCGTLNPCASLCTLHPRASLQYTAFLHIREHPAYLHIPTVP